MKKYVIIEIFSFKTNKYLMKDRINLYWYRHKGGKGNFGDELNPFIIEELSGMIPRYIDIFKLPKNKFQAFKVIINKLITGNFSFKNFLSSEEWIVLSGQSTLVSIGSVISWFNAPNVIVWGAGVISKGVKINKARFLAVRGKHTLQHLVDAGHKCTNTVLGDPALLLPIIINVKDFPKTKKIGIIPHYLHYEIIKNMVPTEHCIVINLLESIESIIGEINACEITVSTSLHGVIVSHAYGIPSLWVDFEELESNKLAGDNVKFKDYFSSMNIPEYDPVSLKSNFYDCGFDEIISLYKDHLLPQGDLVTKVQNNLLKTAPFYLKKEYAIIVS